MFRTTISFIISSSRIYCILQLCTNRANVSTCLVLRLELVLSNSLIIIIIIISNTVLPGGTKLAATFMSRFVTLMTTWRSTSNSPAANRRSVFHRFSWSAAQPADRATAAQRFSNCASNVCSTVTRPCADEQSSLFETATVPCCVSRCLWCR